MNFSLKGRAGIVCFATVAFLAGWNTGWSAEPHAESTLRFDAARLQRLDNVIQHHIDEKQLAGAVMYIARDGETAHLKAFGLQDIEAGKPMATDAIFRIASMSKAVTTVAIMMLYEEGKFRLRDPLSKFLPAFANSVVAVAPPAGSPQSVKFVTVKANRPIEIRDLLTHTAGLTYGDGGLAAELYKKANLSGWYFADRNETIGEAIDRLAKLPLHGHPGESWQYGFGTDVLGRLVEVVSGQPLDRFIEERICRPLGMKDTSFFLPLDKVGRLANVYGIEDGKLVLKESAENSDYVHGPRKCFSGGAGLLSTIGDYGRFLQMLLNGGALDGVRLLSPKTVELMHANHTGDKYVRDTHAFGLGFWVNDDPGYYGELSSEGAYGWGSAYFPQYVVDPKERLVAIFMTQLMPTGGLDLNQRFKILMYQALVK
jgi:CubicO group peptidase (beta-lactamase class C family)